MYNLGLDDLPATTAAMRFLVWSIALATAIVSAHYAMRTPGKVIPARAMWGVSCEAFGWFIHQFYYWLWWRAKGKGQDNLFEALQDIRSITSISLVFVVIGAVLIISPFLEKRFGVYWPLPAAFGICVLWLVGFGDIKWI